MRNLYSQRTAFDKTLTAALRHLLKKSSWRMSGYALFNQTADWYQDIFISVHRNACLTTASLRFKPMGIDPILWDILGIPENRKEPLSFRSKGAFVCSSLPIQESQLEQSGESADHVAAAILKFADDNQTLFREKLQESDFSSLVANHPNQVARGAYATTLITSLINDGNLERALELASSYASGELTSVMNFSSEGVSFHQLSVAWIESALRTKRGV